MKVYQELGRGLNRGVGWDTYDTNRWRYEFYSVRRFLGILT